MSLNLPMLSFDRKIYLEHLRVIVNAPSHTRQIDSFLIQKIENFLEIHPKTDIEVWNFYKEILDLIVYTSGASGFFMRLFDLESLVEPPLGSYSHKEGNMDQAPWRQKPPFVK